MKKIKAGRQPNRSRAGDVGVAIVLMIFGAFFAFPLVYAINAAFKPLNELFIYPPKLFVRNPTPMPADFAGRYFSNAVSTAPSHEATARAANTKSFFIIFTPFGLWCFRYGSAVRRSLTPAPAFPVSWAA